MDCSVWDGGELAHPLLAQLDEPIDAVGLDVPLGGETQLLLHLHLYPEALAVEAVLVALLEALHGLVALVQVLVGASPCVVDAHGVVGGDGAVDERVALVRGVVAVEVLLHHPGLLPPCQDVPLHGGEVYL